MTSKSVETHLLQAEQRETALKEKMAQLNLQLSDLESSTEKHSQTKEELTRKAQDLKDAHVYIQSVEMSKKVLQSQIEET